MIKVLSVVGTRPEAVKMAPVVRELARHPGRIVSAVCSTGQHRELLDQAFGFFGIVPDFDLGLMRPDQGLAQLTARLLEGLDRVIGETRPDWVFAQGDTTTVCAAALAAYYRGVSFGHVEAGLRTGDKRSPFPEEVNRRVADLVADAHFAPTERARRTLLREGCPERSVVVTGNTVIDALLDVAARDYDWDSGPLADLPRGRRFVLVTAHRRESFGAPLRDLCLAVRDLAERWGADGFHFVYPVHLNPNVFVPVREVLSGLPHVSLIDPLDYFSLVHLMKRSVLVLTDSGGIQEEAPGLRVPVLVLRETTERPEGIEAGVARLVGVERRKIVEETTRLLSDRVTYQKMVEGENPYGDGRAAERIVSHILQM